VPNPRPISAPRRTPPAAAHGSGSEMLLPPLLLNGKTAALNSVCSVESTPEKRGGSPARAQCADRSSSVMMGRDLPLLPVTDLTHLMYGAVWLGRGQVGATAVECV